MRPPDGLRNEQVRERIAFAERSLCAKGARHRFLRASIRTSYLDYCARKECGTRERGPTRPNRLLNCNAPACNTSDTSENFWGLVALMACASSKGLAVAGLSGGENEPKTQKIIFFWCPGLFWVKRPQTQDLRTLSR